MRAIAVAIEKRSYVLFAYVIRKTPSEINEVIFLQLKNWDGTSKGFCHTDFCIEKNVIRFYLFVSY